MIKIMLQKEQQLLMHSPLYLFSSEKNDASNVVMVLNEEQEGSYQPFTINDEKQGFLYFDLLSYSFSLQLAQVVKAHQELKGVIRMRRTTNDFAYIEEDLLALSELFGAVRNVVVRFNEKSSIRYVIVLCQFGEQMMAHIEYRTGEDRIEFEWSSHQHILEFDSLQMTGDVRNNHNLYKNIDAIVQFAVKWTTEYDQKLDHIQRLLQEGEQ